MAKVGISVGAGIAEGISVGGTGLSVDVGVIGVEVGVSVGGTGVCVEVGGGGDVWVAVGGGGGLVGLVVLVAVNRGGILGTYNRCPEKILTVVRQFAYMISVYTRL
jgi:hypothetical protein